MREETTVVHSGLHPERYHGAVNPPVFHASTILSETVAAFRRRRQIWILDQPGTYYGRLGRPRLKRSTHALGQTAGPDDVYLGQRGLRTLAVRLKQHWKAGVTLAEWIARQPEVERVLHPALPGDPGHAIWKRDFTGACGLFGVVLKEGITERALCAMIDGLELYGIGSSWGGFESLIVPFDPRETRTATQWPHKGPCFRIHAGLENEEDLIADLEAGFRRLRAA